MVRLCIVSRCLIVGVLVVLPATTATAWGPTGHMIVAQIAYDRLNPDARAKVDELISVFGDIPPKMDSFVSCATWMDEIKGWGAFKFFNGWHFADMPYNPDNLPDVPQPPNETVIWAIDNAKITLESEKAQAFQRALALRMLIHFVGDVHQPLHCADRYTKAHPQGDFGGNAFRLKGEPKELHGYWDDTAGLFEALDPTQNNAWKKKIPEFAQEVVKAVPPDDVPNRTNMKTKDWAAESFDLAVKVAYVGVEPNTKPDKTYQKKAQDVIRNQLALGGYRLAAVLNELYKPQDQR